MFLFMLLLLLLWCTPTHSAVDVVTDDYLDSGLAVSNFITASTGSMWVWYTPTGAEPTGACNAGGAQGVMGDTQGFFKIARRSGTQMCVGNTDASGTDVVQVAYTNTVPTHLVLVHTGGNILMYKDGAVIGSPVASTDTTTLTNQLRLAGTAFFAYTEGRLHAACIYTAALAADEVAYLAGARLLGPLGRTQPTGCWTLDECADGTSCDAVAFRDWSGNGRSMTGNDGANNTGLTGRGENHLMYQGGPQ